MLQVIVLAAGFSSRLGKPKALVRVRGRSLIERTVRLCSTLVPSRIIVVVPPRASRLRAELRNQRPLLAQNPGRARGLSTSVRRGLRQARYSSGVLLLPTDLPQLKRRDLLRLIARWSASRRRVVGRRIGADAGVPLILPRRLYPRAASLSGDAGLRELVHRLPRAQIVLVRLSSADFDVDTPLDLARARRHARRLAPSG